MSSEVETPARRVSTSLDMSGPSWRIVVSADSRIAPAAFAPSGGFAPDARFTKRVAPLPPAILAADPLAAAWAEGYAEGTAFAEDQALALAEQRAAALGRIELAFARLDTAQEETLRQRLHETVTALCEAAIVPLALDPGALASRVARAAAMLARADDARVLRLHPDDLALVASRLPEGLAVEPDPALERGSLRMETASGGIEDGPDQWRRAIAEALSQC